MTCPAYLKMIRYITALSMATLLTGCVEVISDKEAVDRYHENLAQDALNQATEIANMLSKQAVGNDVDVKTPHYNDYPIFAAHAKRLDQLGLPYNTDNVFTTQEYEDAVAIALNYKQQKIVHGDNFNNHEH